MSDYELELSKRVVEYLVPLNQSILFDELSDAYQKKAGIQDILRGVSVPITTDESDNLTTLSIALGMARLFGADPEFRYADAYKAYILRVYGAEFVRILVSEGAKAGGLGRFELACIYFRAALQLNPMSRDAMYLYARACKDAYENEEVEHEEAYIGAFKAESIDFFETLTIVHPDYAMGYYFLGYSYANLGLYRKAQLTWQDFMEKSREIETAEDESSAMANLPADELEALREEIGERVKMLEDPIIIEDACNKILSGDFGGGKSILEEYVDTDYSNWWPLWYYLGTAYANLGDSEGAIHAYKEALKLSPSNTEIMAELAEIYAAIGDRENMLKYQRKIDVVRMSMDDEQTFME